MWGWRQGCVGGGGSAGSVLRSQGSSGKDEAFALLREEKGLIASNARSGPNPLPLGDLEPVPGGSIWSLSLDWAGQRGGRMGSLTEYSHAIFF